MALKAAKRWVDYAEEDLKLAKVGLREGCFRGACLHAHQCVEKLFKALLALVDREIVKTHNLLKLLRIVSSWLVLDVDKKEIEFLNSIYVDARYPSDLGILPEGEPGEKEAQKAVEIAEKVKAHICLKVKELCCHDQR